MLLKEHVPVLPHTDQPAVSWILSVSLGFQASKFLAKRKCLPAIELGQIWSLGSEFGFVLKVINTLPFALNKDRISSSTEIVNCSSYDSSWPLSGMTIPTKRKSSKTCDLFLMIYWLYLVCCSKIPGKNVAGPNTYVEKRAIMFRPVENPLFSVDGQYSFALS